MLEGTAGGHPVQPPKESRSYYRIIFHLMSVQFCILTEHPSKIRELSRTNLKLPVLH